MKSSATNNLSVIFSVVALLFILSSILVGQPEPRCRNGAGEIFCEGGLQAACNAGGGKFNGRCNDISAYAKSLLAGKENEANAKYYSQVSGEQISADELTEEKKQQLVRGEIIKSDGTVITFTPINQIKKYVQENPEKFDRSRMENRFIERERLDGLDKALEEYKKNLGSPNSTPVRPGFFLNFGRELLQNNRLAEAIRIFSFDLEVNKENALESQMELNNAQIKLAEIFIENNQKGKAKTLLNDVVKDKKASETIKVKANERLNTINNQE